MSDLWKLCHCKIFLKNSVTFCRTYRKSHTTIGQSIRDNYFEKKSDSRNHEKNFLSRKSKSSTYISECGIDFTEILSSQYERGLC